MRHSFARALVATFLLIAATSATEGAWPQWRGPNRDDISNETGLLQSWPEGGPKQVWSSKECGLGYAGPAIVGDRMYILGARNGNTMLLCLDAKTGKQHWASSSLGAELENSWGNGPRSTPTVEGDFVYAVTGQGKFACFRTDDGSQVWSKTMQDLGGEVPHWGYSESPLIHGKKILYTPGGDQGAIVALDKTTGELLWQTEGLAEGAHYSSIVVKQHAGKAMGVQLLESQLVGFDLEDGKMLWSVPWGGECRRCSYPRFLARLYLRHLGLRRGLYVGPRRRGI